MRGLWLEDGRVRLRDDLPVPEPAPGEARVRVRVAGICNTDLELIRGYYPFTGVLGHEFVGRVDAGPDELAGRRVVGEINAVCHRCPACRAGRSRHCERRTVLGIVGRNGVFAEYAVLPVENLHPVADDVADEQAVFAEPLAAALEIQEQVAVGPGQRVLVVGDGKLGQLIARTLVRTGCRLQVVGRHRNKLELLAAEGIAAGTGCGAEPGAFDIAVECTGNADGFELARRALRPRGTLVLKSTYADRLQLDASSLVVDEITLIGSRCGPFAPALELLAGGGLDLSGLIAGRRPLAEIERALQDASAPGTLKILVDCA